MRLGVDGRAAAVLLVACVGTAPSASEDSSSPAGTVDSGTTSVRTDGDYPPPRVDLELVMDGQVVTGIGIAITPLGVCPSPRK